MTTNTARITAKLAKIGIADIPVELGIAEEYQVAWYDQSHCPSTNRVQKNIWTDGQQTRAEKLTDAPQGLFSGGTKGTAVVDAATYVIVEKKGQHLNGSTWRHPTLYVADILEKKQECKIVEAVAKYRFGKISTCSGFLPTLSNSCPNAAKRWLLKTLIVDRCMIPREDERLIVAFVGGVDSDRVHFSYRYKKWECSDAGVQTMMQKFSLAIPEMFWAWHFKD
jgi:hypothetical protein